MTGEGECGEDTTGEGECPCVDTDKGCGYKLELSNRVGEGNDFK